MKIKLKLSLLMGIILVIVFMVSALKAGDLSLDVIIMDLVILLISMVVVFFVMHLITKPLVELAAALKDIAEGDGDLTHELNVHTKDEIGDVALYFNETLEKIKKLVKNNEPPRPEGRGI